MTYFRDQQTGAAPPPSMDWALEPIESVRRAHLAKLCLGPLPRRAAKHGSANFDLEDTHTYCGDDDNKAQGTALAGLAAFIVHHAKDPLQYFRALTHVPAKIIEPLKTYLRVKLAVGRLEAEIAGAKSLTYSSLQNATASAPQNTAVISEFAQQISGTLQEQDSVEAWKADERTLTEAPSSKPAQFEASSPPRPRIFSTENPGTTVMVNERVDVVPPPTENPRSYRWNISPAKAYGFAEMTAEYGYDPRDTSAYWIEKRANRLRRKWTAYRKAQTGAPCKPRRKTEAVNEHRAVADQAPLIRNFEPVDADYNSIWPPVKLPDGPPKSAMPPAPLSAPVEASTSNIGLAVPAAGRELAPAEDAVTTVQNTAPASPEFQAIIDAAAAARAEAKAAGDTLLIPAAYAQKFGMTPPAAERPQNTEGDV